MRGSRVVVAAGLVLSAASLRAQAPADASSLIRPEEKHFKNLRQLTFGGENAEAYWSPDGKRLILQARTEADECDQAYVMDVATGAKRLVSTGKGRVTCAYFLEAGRRILYASTHLASPECPPRPDFSKGYVWPMYPGYDIFTANADGSGARRLTETPGYDAEATLSPDGNTIVFTSDAPADDAGLERYRSLLAQGLYAPGALEIWVMDQDGGNKRQISRLGAASFAPYFHPDGKRIIFSSNHPDAKGRNFDLYLVKDDGTGLERITSEPTFDGFPMFSPGGKRLVFASNRGAKARGETNVFVADWVE